MPTEDNSVDSRERVPGVERLPTSEASLRILIVGPSLGILGGQAVQASQLLARLADEPSVKVDFLPVNPQLPGPLNVLQKVKYVRTIVTSLVYIVSLLVRVPQYQVLHVFSASYFSFILAPTPAILVGKLFGKKIILNYRSGEAEDHLKRWPRTTMPIIRLVDAIVVPSGYLVDVFGKFDFSARPIFNIVDLERFRFREREPLRPVFLSNRNFEPHYNVACILRAFAIIQERFPAARLIVAGDGSQRKELEKMANDLASNVQFCGLVSHSKAPDLYDSADVYLNSSDIDNMPVSIIESFAAGLPVVSTNAGGIPYIVEDGKTGLLVGCNDHKSLASRAISLFEESSFASQLTARAIEECRKYCWSAVRQEWLSLYYELAHGNKSRASVRVPDHKEAGGNKRFDQVTNHEGVGLGSNRVP